MTAEECLQNSDKTTYNSIEETMIEFAQYHVEQALIAASRSARAVKVPTQDVWGRDIATYAVDKNSITNAYNKSKIK